MWIRYIFARFALRLSVGSLLLVMRLIERRSKTELMRCPLPRSHWDILPFNISDYIMEHFVCRVIQMIVQLFQGPYVWAFFFFLTYLPLNVFVKQMVKLDKLNFHILLNTRLTSHFSPLSRSQWFIIEFSSFFLSFSSAHPLPPSPPLNGSHSYLQISTFLSPSLSVYHSLSLSVSYALSISSLSF